MVNLKTQNSAINSALSKNGMQKSLKFIHASDIHLGAAQYQNEHRANDFIFAFERILSLAIESQVDFILLGGDVFTSLEMLPGKLTTIINLLKKFKSDPRNNIKIIVIEGNHDIRKFSRGVRFEKRGQSWLKLLSSLGLVILLDADINAPPDQIFRDYDFETMKGGKFRIKNAVIYGTRYFGEKPEEELKKIKKGIDESDGCFHILIQHFGIDGQMENVPGIQYEKILFLREKIDYLALGHYHKQFIIDNWVFNPGSSEAASSIDFSYERGVFLVEIEGSEPYSKKIEKIKIPNRKYRWETISLPTHFKKHDTLVDYVISKLKISLHRLSKEAQLRIKEKPILFLVLKGREPQKPCKIKQKILRDKICEEFLVIDAIIYQKFTNSIRTLDNFVRVPVYN